MLESKTFYCCLVTSSFCDFTNSWKFPEFFSHLLERKMKTKTQKRSIYVSLLNLSKLLLECVDS